MKTINNKFEEIQVNFNYEQLASQLIAFLERMQLDNQIIEDLRKNFKNIIVEYLDKQKKITTKYNGEVINYNLPEGLFAMVYMIDQKQTKNGFITVPGIFLDSIMLNNETRFLHEIIHEFFHSLSQKQFLPYDENGILYSKIGIKIDYYDREDKYIPKKMGNSHGLNEGITELLTRKCTGTLGEQPYLFQTIIAEILSRNNNNLLINAYFSSDKKVYESFLEDFENRQSTISALDLTNLTSKIISDSNTIYDMLRAAVEYSLSYVDEKDREVEVEKIRSIVHELVDNLDYFNYEDIIYTAINDVYNSQRKTR